MHKMNTMVTAQLSEIQTLTHIISLYLCHSVTKSRSPKFWQLFLKLGIIRPKARNKCTKSYNWLIMCISILQYYDLTDFWQLHSRPVRCAQCCYKKTCSRPNLTTSTEPCCDLEGNGRNALDAGNFCAHYWYSFLMFRLWTSGKSFCRTTVYKLSSSCNNPQNSQQIVQCTFG